MPNDPLLTQAELDFIQEVVSQPLLKPCSAAVTQLAIGEQLNALLSHVNDARRLSLSTRSDHEHLSFPLYLVQDGDSQSRIELGAPLIFESGLNERPWRLELPSPLALLDDNECFTGLTVLELSNNGMRVRYTKAGPPAKDQVLQLVLPMDRRVQLRASLVRRVDRRLYAYSVSTLQAEDEQTLRQYLFEQHSERLLQPEATA